MGRKGQERGFLMAELALYLAFLTADLAEGGSMTGKSLLGISDILKYLSVLLCFFRHLNRKEKNLRRAQLLVLAADYFLLFTSRAAEGILCFIGVQFGYRAALDSAVEDCFLKYSFPKLWRIVLFFLLPVCLTPGVSRENRLVLGLACVYAGLLISNLQLAFFRSGSREKRGRNKGLICWMRAGLPLLLLCDIHVALWNLSFLPGSFSAAFRQTARAAMWLFYLPSQVCVALAAKETGPEIQEKRQEKNT